MPGKRNPISDEEKMERKKRDRERQRERRDHLTSEQMDVVRTSDRERKKLNRQKMSKKDKEKVKETDRNRKSCKYKKAVKEENKKRLKEIKNIDKVLRMRTLRSKLSAEQQSRLQNKAKVNMSAGRKNGFVRKYKQREKRDKNHLNIWKKFTT